MKIREPWKEYDHTAVEDKLNSFWSRTQAYNQTRAANKEGKKFYLVDGPPFTTGSVDLGIAKNKILKDSIIRYMRLQGFDVRDQPGFDMHGLPIEVEIENSLGVTGKKGIEDLGLEKFVTACRDFSLEKQQSMVDQFVKLGIWMNWETPFLTIDNGYIESAWWSLKQMHGKDLLVKKNSVLAWCPRCETPLSDSEITYKTVTGPSVYIKVPIKGRRDEYMVVWTTDPWTILTNMAIAVHPDFNYARVKVRLGGRKETLVLLEEKVGEIASIAKIDAYEILETVKGKELEGLQYFHPMMADIPFQKEAEGEWVHKIIAVDSVKPDYTGSVHIAPGHGTEDFSIGTEYKLPMFSPVDERGMFTTEAGLKYAGKHVRDVDDSIIADLKSMRLILQESKEPHRQAHCWRCEEPIIYRNTEQWFLRISEIRDNLLKGVKAVKWTPDWMGSSRQREWIKNARDWCISRQRYWGVPLPIWECITEVCGHKKMVGSVRELKGASGYSKDMDLHRPWIDSVSLECPKCGGLMTRVPDTIDVWFDSGICSWAQLNYPRKKKPYKTWWPSDLIIEGHDQIKGWFYSQLCTGMMVFGKPPYKAVLAHGLVCDSEGRPLSKDSSEEYDFTSIVEKYGTDALRFYLLGNGAPWDDTRAKPEDVRLKNRTLRVLWNTVVFSAKYMRMDDFDPFAKGYDKVKKHLQPEDSWILSKIETLTNDVKREMEVYRMDNVCELLENFILHDFSRWYIKIIRPRMWKEGGSNDKVAAYKTLHEVLTRLAIISSPVIPYISEEIYQTLDGRKLSVHMCEWPEPQPARVAEGVEKSMDRTHEVVEVIMSLRQKHDLKLRWPVQKIIISSSLEEVTDAVDMFKEVIKTQANIKKMEVVPPGQEWEGQVLEVIPHPNVIGKAYKQWESKIARMLKVLPAKDVKEKIGKGEYHLGIEGQNIRILPDMVEFKTKLPDGIISEDFETSQIFLDITVNDEIKAEGYAREMIRRIQDMRRDMEMDIEEYIKLNVVMSQYLLDLLDEFGQLEMIADTTRANQMDIIDEADGDYIIEWEIEDETVIIGVTSLDIKKAVDEFIKVPTIDRKLALSLVDAGITGGTLFTDTQREFILKFPGMTNAKFRKIKEYFGTPEEHREEREAICPICEAEMELGASSCRRCGGRPDEVGEIPDVEILGGFSEEEKLAEELLSPEMLEYADEEEEEEEEEEITPRKPVPAPEPEAAAPIEPESPPEEELPVEEPDIVEEELPPTEEAEEELPVEGPDIVEEELPPTEEAEEELPPEEEEPQPPEKGEAPAPLEEDVEELPPEEPVIEDEIEEVAEGAVVIKASELIGEIEGEAGAISEVTEDVEEQLGEKPPSKKGDIIGGERDRAIALLSKNLDISPSVAKLLHHNGYHSVESLVGVEEETLRDIKGIGKISARLIVEALSDEETQMCTLCNAIVPVTANACTRCGVRFASEEESIKEAEKQMSTLELIEEELKKTPDDVKLLHSKSMTLRDVGKVEEAMEVIEKALEIASDDKKLLDAKASLAESAEPEEESLPEEPTEKAELEPEAEHDEVDLKESFTYLITEERSVKAYELFKKMSNKGMPGYCITRTFPDKIRSRYELGDMPILWLSNVPKEDAVRPKDLEKLSLSLEEFLSKEGGVVLLDGIEYLITNNNFITVLKLIQSLRDQVAINRSVLLLSINPSTMDAHELNLLKREVDMVID